jgi:hypothetical protein
VLAWHWRRRHVAVGPFAPLPIVTRSKLCVLAIALAHDARVPLPTLRLCQGVSIVRSSVVAIEPLRKFSWGRKGIAGPHTGRHKSDRVEVGAPGLPLLTPPRDNKPIRLVLRHELLGFPPVRLSSRRKRFQLGVV